MVSDKYSYYIVFSQVKKSYYYQKLSEKLYLHNVVMVNYF